ncbi:hypothetical protein Curi_c23620 [Gottschalkia acidurici 9a]|uniref:Uncharacterized protein n=1 Tax=Gottschalkia acidurici (strain ATCC 7906 / DSM 604 / BCRC 14475 / CIP 104303 / KCTC 5404 / NCIMB 10678 / 9a) TaxID=1128398 RepID=K0B2L9_GOTA9|nr:hypothetical protein [Gottschalkia acidurici]AFS79357.1 hypothetical protein Curi_c23620 [Gottschalkia acidurici 9a]
MDKFLRIIGPNEYENYLRESIYKYIPRNILHTFQEKIKPRAVCNYIDEDTKETVGYGIGIFLDENKLTREEYVDRIINSIKILKEQDLYKNVEYLVMDNIKLGYDDIKRIQEKSNIKIPDAKSYFIENIIQLLSKICNAKNKDLQEQEILIISDDTNDTEDIVVDISSNIKYLTIYSHNEEFGKNLERIVLEDTGLSLHITKNIDKLMGNVDFIINLCEDVRIDIKKIKKYTVLIDISKNKVLSRDTEHDRKKIMLIDDLFFRNDRKIYSEVKDYDLNKELNTSLSKFFKNSNKDIVKLKIYDKIYSVQQGVSDYSFQKRNISPFDGK